MYIKRYTIAAFILMALVGGFVFSYVSQETRSIDFFGIPLPSLSIAIWVVVPLFVLYLASVAHMSFYSLLGSFKLRKYEKDFEKIIDAIIEAYLGKKIRKHTFKTDRYRLMGTLLENTALFPTGEIIGHTNNEKLETALKSIEEIKRGEVTDLKPYNLLIENELVVQNERNRYKKGDLSVEDILSNPSKYAEELKKEVYTEYVKTASIFNIEKYKALTSKESLYIVTARVNAASFTLDISNETLLTLIEKLDFNEEDFIKLSSVLSHSEMIPEQRMKLFELLSETHEDATPAYLYTLFDLEMIPPAAEILDNSQADEYQKFKAYKALKDSNKHFSIELFI